MKARDFAKGLKELAKRHEKDEVGIFDTNWSEICLKTADYIIHLDNELKDKEEQIDDFKRWYAMYEKEITKAINKSKEVDIPDFVTKPEEPEPISVPTNWDGKRRDFEDDFTPANDGEKIPFDEDTPIGRILNLVNE